MTTKLLCPTQQSPPIIQYWRVQLLVENSKSNFDEIAKLIMMEIVFPRYKLYLNHDYSVLILRTKLDQKKFFESVCIRNIYTCVKKFQDLDKIRLKRCFYTKN